MLNITDDMQSAQLCKTEFYTWELLYIGASCTDRYFDFYQLYNLQASDSQETVVDEASTFATNPRQTQKYLHQRRSTHGRSHL